jgi:hypothetical protein
MAQDPHFIVAFMSQMAEAESGMTGTVSKEQTLAGFERASTSAPFGGFGGTESIKRAFGNPADRFAMDQSMARLTDAMAGKVRNKVEATGQLDVNVCAPPGTNVRACRPSALVG